jgi:hypothetical protein
MEIGHQIQKYNRSRFHCNSLPTGTNMFDGTVYFTLLQSANIPQYKTVSLNMYSILSIINEKSKSLEINACNATVIPYRLITIILKYENILNYVMRE